MIIHAIDHLNSLVRFLLPCRQSSISPGLLTRRERVRRPFFLSSDHRQNKFHLCNEPSFIDSLVASSPERVSDSRIEHARNQTDSMPNVADEVTDFIRSASIVNRSRDRRHVSRFNLHTRMTPQRSNICLLFSCRRMIIICSSLTFSQTRKMNFAHCMTRPLAAQSDRTGHEDRENERKTLPQCTWPRRPCP